MDEVFSARQVLSVPRETRHQMSPQVVARHPAAGGLGGGLGGDGLGGGEDVLRATVRALRDQLDAVTRRLGGRTSLDDRDVL